MERHNESITRRKWAVGKLKDINKAVQEGNEKWENGKTQIKTLEEGNEKQENWRTQIKHYKKEMRSWFNGKTQ